MNELGRAAARIAVAEAETVAALGGAAGELGYLLTKEALEGGETPVAVIPLILESTLAILVGYGAYLETGVAAEASRVATEGAWAAAQRRAAAGRKAR